MSPSTHLVYDKTKLQKIHELHEPIGTIGEVLEKASSLIEDNAETGKQAIATAGQAAGWLSWIEPGAAMFSILALGAKVLGKWAEIKDPYEQGALACTLAWQAAANRALAESGISNIFTYRRTRGLGDRIAKRLRALPKPEEVSLATFSWTGTAVHPFVQRADDMLRTFLRSVHEDDQSSAITAEQEIRIFDDLHEGFKHELEKVLYSNETKGRFAFFAELLKTDRAEAERARQALHIHADYQQRLYTSLPLFGQEEFALGDVYIDTQCGELTWGNISRAYVQGPASKRDAEAGEVFGLNPFLEKNGGRKDLLQTVMRLLIEAPLNEPIVIQGFAGQGKSSFTLRLCAELMKPEHGFTPLRIRLKNLPLDGDLFEGLARALELDEPDPQRQHRYSHLAGFKLDKTLLDDQHGLHAKMSRYVVILDGWDELQIGGDAGFRKRVEEVMRRVRETFLQGGWSRPPRIIVTGRPNPEVEASALLQRNTPFLTIRDLRAGHLRVFVRKLALAQAAARLTPSVKEGVAYEPWRVPRPAVFNPVFLRAIKKRLILCGAMEAGCGTNLKCLALPCLLIC